MLRMRLLVKSLLIVSIYIILCDKYVFSQSPDSLKTKEVFSDITFNSQLLFQQVSDKNLKQNGFVFMNRNVIGHSLFGVPLLYQFYIQSGEGGANPEISGFNFSFDVDSWKNIRLKKIKQSIEKTILDQQSQTGDSLVKYNNLLRKLSDTLFIENYSKAKITLKKLQEADTTAGISVIEGNSFANGSDSVRNNRDKLITIISQYDSVKNQFSEYQQWRSKTIDGYSKLEKVKELQMTALKKEGIDADSLSFLDRALSNLRSFSLGTSAITESPLTFDGFVLSGVNLEYGKRISLGLRYGVSKPRQSATFKYLSDNFEPFGNTNRKIQNVFLTVRNTEGRLTKIQLIRFEKTRSANIESLQFPGNEAIIFHAEESAKVLSATYKLEGASMIESALINSGNFIQNMAARGELQNNWQETGNLTKCYLTYIGSNYYSHGNINGSNSAGGWGIRTMQPVLHKKVIITFGFETKDFGREPEKYRSDVWSSGFSWNPADQLSINYSYNDFIQKKILNESIQNLSNSGAHSLQVVARTNMLFKNETSQFNIYYNKSHNISSDIIIYNTRVAYYGNFILSDGFSVQAGASYSEINSTPELSSIQKSVNSGINLKLLKKGQCSFGVTETVNSKSDNLTSYNLQFSYSFKIGISAVVSANTRYFHDDQFFVNKRNTSIYRASLIYTLK